MAFTGTRSHAFGTNGLKMLHCFLLHRTFPSRLDFWEPEPNVSLSPYLIQMSALAKRRGDGVNLLQVASASHHSSQDPFSQFWSHMNQTHALKRSTLS